tara:strand:+ start:225 stop:569 length:345 start_codon:yes stop_codon:yes gene_type:complete
MYRTITKLLILIIFAWVMCHYTYWWSFCIPALFIGCTCNSNKESILINSIGCTCVWLTELLYNILNGGDILIARVSNVFGFSNQVYLILITSVIPIVLGAISGWTGFQFRRKHD